jgi:hypothetical protein
MEMPLSDLSGTELRKLMICELKQFMLLLDTGTPGELQQQKAHLSEIFARLSVKEQEELQHLITLVSKLSLPAHLQLRSEKPIVLPAFDPANSSLSASHTQDDSAPSTLQQSA